MSFFYHPSLSPSLPQLLHQRQQLIQIFQLVPAFQLADHEVHTDIRQQAQLHFFPRQAIERAARCRCVRRKLYAHYCLRASPLYLATSCSTVVPSTRASATPKLRPGYLTPFSTKLTYSCVTPRRCASCACVIFFCSRRSFTSLPNIFYPPFRTIRTAKCQVHFAVLDITMLYQAILFVAFMLRNQQKKFQQDF
nr:MAG TPA_asm: hypothetical protein [Caudoviricetes sp.]